MQLVKSSLLLHNDTSQTSCIIWCRLTLTILATCCPSVCVYKLQPIAATAYFWLPKLEKIHCNYWATINFSLSLSDFRECSSVLLFRVRRVCKHFYIATFKLDNFRFYCFQLPPNGQKINHFSCMNWFCFSFCLAVPWDTFLSETLRHFLKLKCFLSKAWTWCYWYFSHIKPKYN